MVAVMGISASSKADLLAELDRLGTNLLTAAPGETLFGQDAKLPAESVGMIGRIDPVTSTSATADLDAAVYGSDRIRESETGDIGVKAVSTDLLATLQGRVRSGTFLNEATSRYPAVVLGSVAADASASTAPTGRCRCGWAGDGSPWWASWSPCRWPPRWTARP